MSPEVILARWEELDPAQCRRPLSAFLIREAQADIRSLCHQLARALFERDFWATAQGSFDLPEDSREHPCTKAGHKPLECPDWGKR